MIPDNCHRTRSKALLTLFAVLLIPAGALAQVTTQEVTLVAGWNAIWLEVEPRDGDGIPVHPTVAFDTVGNTAILKIASPKPLAGLADFFGDSPTPETGTFNQDGWEQWVRGGVDNDLVMTTGNRAYLIETDAKINITVTGAVRFFRPEWTPDRYNLLGFGTDASVTIGDFFAPSGETHPVGQIYTLAADGNWSLVTATDPMQPAATLPDKPTIKAYWIFSDGPSDYMGPVAVDFDSAAIGTLSFAGPGDAVDVKDGGGAIVGSFDLEEMVFTNLSAGDVTPTLTERLSSELALTEITPEPGSFGHLKGNNLGASFSFPTGIPAGRSDFLTLGADARRLWAGPVDRTNLYRLNTGAGSEFYLPVTALHDDLRTSGTVDVPDPDDGVHDSNLEGLWVGEVIYNSATSIVEIGSPARPTSGSAPMRILLHSDADGDVTLLNQVTIMQTRTADPGVEPEPVLVVDPRQIQFFEGIAERNGKRVGLRLQTVGYDMPRSVTVAAQTEAPEDRDPDTGDLIDMIVTESGNTASNWAAGLGQYSSTGEGADRTAHNVDEAAIVSYLAFRTIRPPALKEVYHLAWPLNGFLGAGQTISTLGDGFDPLTLDPFHRSNPFRHAFHQQHPRGPNITREMTLAFDADQPISGRLRGTFTETFGGLIRESLVLSGRVELGRVSTVGSLEGYTP